MELFGGSNQEGGWQAISWQSPNLFVGQITSLLIPETEDIYRGIRIRYSMDEERATKAAADTEELIKEIWQAGVVLVITRTIRDCCSSIMCIAY